MRSKTQHWGTFAALHPPDSTRKSTRPTRHFGQHLGTEIGEALQNYLRLIVLGNQDLPHYAEALQVTATFFTDIATTYHENKDRPPQHRIRRDLESMPESE